MLSFQGKFKFESINDEAAMILCVEYLSSSLQ
jgi:hypothetical protein